GGCVQPRHAGKRPGRHHRTRGSDLGEAEGVARKAGRFRRRREGPGLGFGSRPPDPRVARDLSRGRGGHPRPHFEGGDPRTGLLESDGTGAAGMILAVAWNRFLNLKHDRAAFVLAFVVPIVFFSVFALIFGGTRSATRRVGLILVDEDSSENSRRFAAALAAEKGLDVESSRAVASSPDSVPYDRDSALAAVRGGKVSVALVIPKGFGAAPLDFGNPAEKKPRLILYADTADPVAPQLVSGVLQKVVV